MRLVKKTMKAVKNTSLAINPEMPTDLKAKLEFSVALDLFRMAADHHLQYMILLDSAFGDIEPVVEWFSENKKYQEGIQWLYDNTPDCLPRVLAINALIEAEKADKASVSVP